MNAWQTNPKGRLRGGYLYPWALKEFNLLFFRKLDRSCYFRQLQHLITRGRKLLQFQILQFALTDKRDVFLHRRVWLYPESRVSFEIEGDSARRVVWLRNHLYFCNVARLLSVFGTNGALKRSRDAILLSSSWSIHSPTLFIIKRKRSNVSRDF